MQNSCRHNSSGFIKIIRLLSCFCLYFLTLKVGLSSTFEAYANVILQVRKGVYNGLFTNFFYEPLFMGILGVYSLFFKYASFFNLYLSDFSQRFIPAIIFGAILVCCCIWATRRLGKNMLFFHSIMVLDSTLCSLPWHLTRTYVAVILTIAVTQKCLLECKSIKKWRLGSIIPPLAHWSFWTLPLLQLTTSIRIGSFLRKKFILFFSLAATCFFFVAPLVTQKLVGESIQIQDYFVFSRIFEFLSGQKLGELSFLICFLGMTYFVLLNCKNEPWYPVLKWMAIIYALAFLGLSNEPILNRLKCLFWPLYLYLFCFYNNQNRNSKACLFKWAFFLYFAALACFHQASGSYKNRIPFFSWGLDI